MTLRHGTIWEMTLRFEYTSLSRFYLYFVEFIAHQIRECIEFHTVDISDFLTESLQYFLGINILITKPGYAEI